MQRTVIIMAGGSGERFWPVSRRQRPKQLLKLTSPEKTMLSEAIERIAPLIAPRDIFIITSALLQQSIRDAMPNFPPENIIAEPHKRNTAGCIALGAAFIAERYRANGIDPSDLSMAILTADHAIGEAQVFRQTVDAALQHAESTSDLVTIGIVPARAETGYGYIEFDPSEDNIPAATYHARAVRRFLEKPDARTAEKFVQAGNYLWNSGMFFWRWDTVVNGLRTHLPEVGGRIETLRNILRDTTSHACIGAPEGTAGPFGAMPDISIDYGLLEKAERVAVIRAEFPWDDVGSWDSMARIRNADSDGNITIGGPTLIDSRDCIVVNDSGSDAMAVAVVGLENVVVVTTPDGILVCPRDRVQDVKKAVRSLRDKYGERFA